MPLEATLTCVLTFRTGVRAAKRAAALVEGIAQLQTAPTRDNPRKRRCKDAVFNCWVEDGVVHMVQIDP